MKPVHHAQTLFEAQMVCDFLRTQGIEARVENAELSAGFGELPIDTSTLPTVYVLNDGRAAEAEALLRSHRPPKGGEDD